ncbi:MAG: hypothetical protein VB100_04660 [Angelakisella sp.]|nr:hypothetical protein [Angelakisella sp.]
MGRNRESDTEKIKKLLFKMETDGLNTTQITEFFRITTKEEFDPKTVKNRLRLLYDEVGGRVNNRDFFAANNCDDTKPLEKLPSPLPPFKISSRIIRPVLLLISFKYFDNRVTTSKESTRQMLNDNLIESIASFLSKEEYAAVTNDIKFLNNLEERSKLKTFITAFSQLMHTILHSTHISRMAMLDSASQQLKRLNVYFAIQKQHIAEVQMLGCSKPEDYRKGSLVGAFNAQSLGDYFISKIIMASQKQCDFVETFHYFLSDETTMFEQQYKNAIEEIFAQTVECENTTEDAYQISEKYSGSQKKAELLEFCQKIEKALKCDPKIDETVVRYLVTSFRHTFLQIGASKNTDELAEALVENCLNQNK